MKGFRVAPYISSSLPKHLAQTLSPFHVPFWTRRSNQQRRVAGVVDEASRGVMYQPAKWLYTEISLHLGGQNSEINTRKWIVVLETLVQNGTACHLTPYPGDNTAFVTTLHPTGTIPITVAPNFDGNYSAALISHQEEGDLP